MLYVLEELLWYVVSVIFVLWLAISILRALAQAILG